MAFAALRRLLGLPEAREAATNYEALLIGAQLAAASGTRLDSGTAAVETAVGAWSRATSRLRPEPDNRRLEALTPDTLADIGRTLATRGESLHVIDVRGGRLRLLRASDWDVRGEEPDPASWSYRATMAAPSGSPSLYLPSAAVLHVRWGASERTPWRGRSPLSLAAETARLMAGSERSAGDEFALPVARMLRPPDGELTIGPGDYDSETGLRALTASFAEATKAAAGRFGGVIAFPAPGKTERIGPEPAEATEGLRESAERSILRAYGLSPALFNEKASGTAIREAWRIARATTFEAVAGVIAAECRRKLHPEARLSSAALKVTDLAAQSRAVHVLVESGLPSTQALAIAGLVSGTAELTEGP